ncbi:MAG TPA: tRNA pseudouridine(55) synthase TruB, partial [Clostridiaceae bacterium]|nr:tRNA pseudouridine(55) synthase TruB [Clostridiaceae bacterium]
MNGILNINKGLGLTSFDVVFKIKKLAHTKKVGHTGTLDPEASGVLPICIGGATKFADYIMKDDKVYRATLRLGIVTDTYDKEGAVLRTSEVTSSEEEVISVINGFEGRIKQVPPMYSALKVNGQRLYSLARKGIEIERVARDIEIFSIEIIEMDLPIVVFDVKCSKGTYIRSLCYDIGEKLGCGGAMWALVRTRSGFFDIENSVRLEDLTEENIADHLISVEKALWNYPSAVFETKYVKLLL